MLITKVILKLGLSVFLATLPAAAQSQIAPDGSLPTNVQQLQEIMKINGGERAGNNLFHSFDEFSIPEGMEAIFENALDIQNIFTRITGGDVSNIDGLLKTQGGANLFLINPNGVVFGENAQLDVGGSFIATTADSIEFADNTSFSASDSKPILSIDFPIGLGFGSNSGSITVNGNGNIISRQSRFGFTPYVSNGTSSGLSVPSGETLALVGNGINFNGGAIVSEGAQISLGSVTLGVVNLEKNEGNFNLEYEEVEIFNDINFKQNSLLDSSGASSSLIEVFGKNIALLDTSALLIQNDNTSANEEITVNASDSLIVEEGSNITTETIGKESASPIKINATNILLKDQGSIISGAFGTGNSGNLDITAAEKFEIINSASAGFPGGLISFTVGSGNAGNVTISTQEFRASQGSAIASSTAGLGGSGVLNINADSIELNGTTAEEGIFTFIGTTSLGEGIAGNVNINTVKLRLLNGAAISSDSSSDANAGNIQINASDSVKVIGLDPNTTNQSSINSSVTKLEDSLRERLGLPSVPNGNSGNVTIKTPELTVAQEGAISVENQGSGEGGTVNISADELNIKTGGSITADTVSGNGGNIIINTSNLTSKKNGNVSTNAEGLGDGGNITITADTLLGIQNSDITANAVEGNGGNIVINSDFILGFEERVRLTPFSDITATSELGLDGTVTINSPENNSNEDLIISAKEVNFYSNQQLFPDGCNNRNGSRMKIAYLNSGSPESPDDFFDDDEPLSLQSGEESVSYVPEVESEDNVPPLWQEGDPVIEGNMIQTNSDGRVYFVAVDQEKTAESMVCTREAEDRK